MDQHRQGSVAIILAIMKKDLLQFSRDKLYMGLSIVGMIMYVATFWLIPAQVTEHAVIGVSYSNLGPLGQAFEEAGGEGLRVLVFPDPADLARVIAKEAEAWLDSEGSLHVVDRGNRAARPKGGSRQTLTIGLAFGPAFLPDLLSGRQPAVRVLVNNDTPIELQQTMQTMIREMVYMVSGHQLPIREPAAETMVLGIDRMGAQISMRDRMRPMLVFFVLMMESFSLASLIAIEISHRTALAIVATPARNWHLLVAKTLFGMILAFGQAAILLAAIGAFSSGSVLIILAAALLGALMFSGISMFVGSMGKDFMGTLTWTMLFVLPFSIPAFSALFPGSAAAWVRFVPSYGIIDILNRAANYGEGWVQLAPSFGLALLWVLLILGFGLHTLSRKVARL